MCGIAGWVGVDDSPGASLVSHMLRPIRHRGPDGEGTLTSGGVTLGHRRLSVLDLSDLGAQPMRRGSLAVTYNGEIYNYIELRDELRNLGHHFHTATDTEVLLAAYAQWGTECVTHFDGMWAFALHDSEAGIVFCSRDRFGEKPFLFSLREKGLLFGSEVKQFQAVGIGCEANRDAVLEFLVLGSKADVGSTFNAGVQSLPAATNMVISCETAEISTHRYYTPGTLGLFDAGSDEIGELLAHEFGRAVTIRLRSDVPVGMLLSGGVDSSLIASVAGRAYREATGEPLVALTAITGDPRNDESEYARMVAEAADLAWEPVSVPASATRTAWAQATSTIEQPLGSSSHVLQLNVMRRARERGCTVLLDGQGADESWMGYPRYTVAARKDLPWRARASFAWRSADRTGLGVGSWLAYWVYFRFPRAALLSRRHHLRPLGLTFTAAWFIDRFDRLSGPTGGSIRDLQRQQIMGEQLGALLRYADRTSMAFSLEDRLPFLDYRLVELAIATPTALKFKSGWPKWPLRRQLARSVPASVAWRKGKVGFEAAGTSFQPTDPDALALIRGSAVLQDLGIHMDRLNDCEPSVLWRLFSIALWEAVCLTESAGP